MATWTGVVTNAGKNLFASWINNGTTLNFDAAEGGAGTVPEPAMLAQTALADKKQDISIIGGSRVKDGIKLTIQITPPAEGYTLNQIGIKASIDGGAKVLAALFQLQSGIGIPGIAQNPDFIYKFFGIIAVSNTGTFSLTVDTAALVAQSTLDAAMATKQSLITADGILLGDGEGGITAAIAGVDYGYPLPSGDTDPTTDTAGSVGQHYFNTTTGHEFVCIGKSGDDYVWKRVGATDAADLTYKEQKFEDYLTDLNKSIDSAQSTADDANVAAQAAHDAAADAAADALIAQTTADFATATAGFAQTAADNARQAADNAQTTADEAKELATNAAKADLSNVSNADFAEKAHLAGIIIRTFELDITFEAAFIGETFTVSGGGFTYSGTVPKSLHTAVDVPKPNTTYTVAVDGCSEVVKTAFYFGIYPVDVRTFYPVFAENSWQQIGRAIEHNIVPATWITKNEKDITLSTGEPLTMQIYGPDHDDLVSGGKARFTLGLKNLMAEQRRMNNSNTNAGGITGSAMQSWLQNTVFPALPPDLRAITKPVYKKTSAGSGNAKINTDVMSIFSFSEVEYSGATLTSFAGEGTQYPIFTDNASRIKRLANGAGAADGWWGRSPRGGHSGTGNSTYFSFVQNSGAANTSPASSTYGVCFGVCI